MSSQEVRATSVLMAQFQTVMFVRAEFAARGPDEKLSALDPLRGPVTQRLYSYLAKKDYKSRFYEERVVNIGRRLGLAKTSPSDIRASLEPACEVLLRPFGAGRKAFLRSFAFEGARAHMKLVVETNREQDVDDASAVAARGRQVVEELRRRFTTRR